MVHKINKSFPLILTYFLFNISKIHHVGSIVGEKIVIHKKIQYFGNGCKLSSFYCAVYRWSVESITKPHLVYNDFANEQFSKGYYCHPSLYLGDVQCHILAWSSRFAFSIIQIIIY
jgi:hypothetical protein